MGLDGGGMGVSKGTSAGGLFDAVALWSGIGVVLALLVSAAQVGAATWIMIWVIAHCVLAILAATAAIIVRRGSGAELERRRAADGLAVLSAALWGLGAALLGGNVADTSALPMMIVASGLACAAVWLFHTQLLLLAGVLGCLLLPTLLRLLMGDVSSQVTALIIPMLVIVNVLISRRLGGSYNSSPVLTMPDREVKRIEAEAKFQADRINQELRAEVERHKNIEGELKSAKLAAEAAAMSKGEFLATMSHEIRTPLNGIIPLLEILRGTKLQPDQREYLGTAYSSARHLLRIIDDILDYSKIEAGKLELEQVGVNVRDLMDSVVRLLERSANEKNLRMSVQIEPGVRLAVRGDPVRLRQVLSNLVSNAIKFTEKGSVTIQLSKRSETRTHVELMFAVRDTGIGIAPDQSDRLFKPFAQADTSTTRQFGGTGLGLTICKRLVDLMGGKIGLKSEVGKGSIFWFALPLLKAIGDVSQGRRELNGARALLVGSDARVTQRIGTFLSSAGLHHTTATTSADAISKLKSAATLGANWGHDVCIVDLGSMRATAPALARNFAREPALENLKIIYILADDSDLPTELADSKRVGTINKIFSEASVLVALNRALESERPEQHTMSLLEAAAELGGDDFSAPPADKPPSQISAHVLLVEDNPVNRQVAHRLLSLLGITIENAENGQEALDKLSLHTVDAVLMDCQMPVMDGYTATRERRALEAERKLPRVPIIAMTANAMAGDREKCLNSGMDDYMSKPLNRLLLEQTLRKWVNKAGKEKPPSVPSTSMLHPVSGADALPDIPIFNTEPVRMTPLAPRPAPTPALAAVRMPAPAPLAARSVAQPPLPARAPAPQAEPEIPEPKVPAIDRSIYDELYDVMGDEFETLIKVYLDDTPRNLKTMVDAAARNDMVAMVAPAHSLKSTSANLGALHLADIAKHIEQVGRTGQLMDAPYQARRAVAEFQRAAAELCRIQSTH